MAVYMVERELPGVTMDQLSAAQKAAIATSEEFSAAGKTVRYIRTTFVPVTYKYSSFQSRILATE